MPRKKKQEPRRGREKGTKLEAPVILFNRWNLMFYTTIKGKTSSGKEKVIGRDYSKHKAVYDDKHDDYTKAHDALITKFLKSLKKATYKEDIIRDVPYFIVLVNVKDVESKVDLFEPMDVITNHITDKEASFERLDKYYATALTELIDVYGKPDLVAKTTEKWNTLKIASAPVGKEKSQSERIKHQLDLFEW